MASIDRGSPDCAARDQRVWHALVVRKGSSEGADLVAERQIPAPAWHAFFARTQMSRALQMRMRLAPANHKVRALDRQWRVTWGRRHAKAGAVDIGQRVDQTGVRAAIVQREPTDAFRADAEAAHFDVRVTRAADAKEGRSLLG